VTRAFTSTDSRGRRLLAVVALALVTWLALPSVAQAAPPSVVDEANLLSSAQEAALSDRIAAIKAQYDFDVVIHTVSSLGTQTPAQASQSFFAKGGYGPDGISYLVAMGTRDWWIEKFGTGLTYFTAYGNQVIADRVVKLLSQGNYDQSFNTFLDLVESFLDEARTNRPYDNDNKYLGYNPYVVAGAIGGGVGLIAAGATVLVWKRRLKTARPATEALAYQVPGSLQYTVKEDQLVNSHTAVVPIPQTESRGFSGGGGFSSTSSGFGGKF